MATNTSSTLSVQFQKYFDPQLLTQVLQDLELAKFAQKGKRLPGNAGAKNISFMRFNAPSASNVQTLTEGTPPTNTTDLTLTEVNVTLNQYGEILKLTDVLTYTTLYQMAGQAVKLLGQDCALHVDTLIRDTIVGAVTGTGQRRYAQGTTNFSGLSAASNSGGKFIMTDLLDAVTQLKIQRALKFNGKNYVCIAPPQVSRDITNDDDFMKVSTYANAGNIYNNELGMFHGCKILEATNPFRETSGGTEGTFAANGGIFSTLIFGDEAFGAPDFAKMPISQPKITILDKADKSDPLNQQIVVGWKAYYNAVVLNSNWIVNLKAKTEFA